MPNQKSFAKLKRLCRYLVGKPRLVYEYNWSDPKAIDRLDVYVDTDFAGCADGEELHGRRGGVHSTTRIPAARGLHLKRARGSSYRVSQRFR